MRLLITRGTIQRHQESSDVDHAALRGTVLTTQDLLAAMIAEQSAAARRVLTYLALADAAVATATLERVLASAAPTDDIPRALDEADLALPLDGQHWRIGHDLVADLVLHQAPAALRRELSLDLAMHADADAASVTDVRRVVRWFLDAEAPDAMIHAVRRWATRTMPGLKGAALADLLLGAGATPAIRSRLIRAVPERSRFTIPIVFTVLITTACLVAILSLWLHQPARLVLVNQPVHLGFIGTPPMLEVRNRLGQLSTGLDGTRVQLVRSRGADSITGVDRTPIHHGLVVLDSMRIWRRDTLSTPSLEVTLQATTLAPVSFALNGSLADSLWLESGMLNEQALTPREPSIRVARGARITGWVRARYSVEYGGILVMLARYTSWREPRLDTLSLASLLIPAERAYLFKQQIDLPGPAQPGTYWLIWTFASEPAAKWIGSSTSWRCGAPVWDDGNEKGQLSATAFAGAWGTGRTTFRKLTCEIGSPRRYETQSIPAMAIRILVE